MEFQFDGRFELGKTFTQISMDHPVDGIQLHFPIIVVRGAKKGPKIALVAGIHGREIQGMAVLQRAIEQLDYRKLSGTMYCIPVANPLAVRTIRQDFPREDGRWLSRIPACNLNRVWPGKPDGSLLEVMAWTLWSKIISQCDYCVDLHGHADRCTFFAEGCRRDRDLVFSFGANCILIERELDPKKKLLNMVAAGKGIPTVLIEFPAQTRLRKDLMTPGVRGIFNVLCHLKMYDGRIKLPAVQVEWGDEEISIDSPCAGLFVADKKPDILVEKGERLGVVLSLDTMKVGAEIRAPRKGYVIALGTLTPENSISHDIVLQGECVAILRLNNRIHRNSAI